MKTTKAKKATAAAEPSLAKPGRPRYELRLYVSGLTRRSTRAIANIKEICEENLRGRYVLQVVDIYQQPVLAVDRVQMARVRQSDASADGKRPRHK